MSVDQSLHLNLIFPKKHGWCCCCKRYRENRYVLSNEKSELLCDECHTSPRFKSLKIIDTRKPPRKNDNTKKQTVTKEYDRLLISQIIEILTNHDPMNRDDIFNLIVVDFYKSKKRVDNILLRIKREGLIIGEKKNRNDQCIYTTPEKRGELLQLQDRVYYQEFMNYVKDEWTSIDKLGIKRSKCTLYRWVEMSKAAGLVEVKITPLPNKKGYYKFVKKK
jgi:hypothetical protein